MRRFLLLSQCFSGLARELWDPCHWGFAFTLSLCRPEHFQKRYTNREIYNSHPTYCPIWEVGSQFVFLAKTRILALFEL